MTERSCLLLTSLAAAGLLAASGAGAEPFATRNQNPLVTLFGLPTPLPARLSADGPGRLGVMANWGNMATIRGRDDNLLVDAETVELRVAYERSAGSRFAIRAEVPWRSIGGGSLDGVAETWHDLLGLPDGDRAGLPRDQLQVRYTVDDAVLLDFNESASGIGDVTLAGGYPLYASDRASVAAWLTAKLLLLLCAEVIAQPASRGLSPPKRAGNKKRSRQAHARSSTVEAHVLALAGHHRRLDACKAA